MIVEEINRANVAAVFGDVFQLLDRDNDNVSEYSIQASEDMKKYLAKELGGNPNEYSEIKLPDNMFIWASMNSADQGVFLWILHLNVGGISLIKELMKVKMTSKSVKFLLAKVVLK